MTGQNTFEGIAFTNGILNEGGNATLHGPVLADTANMAGNGDTRTIINPPPGAPGAAYDETTNRVGRRHGSVGRRARIVAAAQIDMAAFAANCSRRLRRRAADDDGFGLIELLIAMTMLTIAIGALVTVFTSSAVSLRRAGQKGTALTLADTQMEKYRTRTFTAVRIDGTLIPTSGTYVTANSTDSTIPASTNQAVAGPERRRNCSTTRRARRPACPCRT